MRRQTAEHPFGTIKHWMGSTHFLTKTLARVSTEMSLHVLAYNLKRLISILGIAHCSQPWEREGIGPLFTPQLPSSSRNKPHTLRSAS